MTTMFTSSYTCSVCGQSTEQRVIGSTNMFGYSDLDLRPPQMRRSTMPLWLQTCPSCGYVAPELSDETKATREWLASDEYLSLDGLPEDDLPHLAITFYRRHKILLLDGDPVGAARNLLRAAWACDDEQLTDLARELRRRCAKLIDDNPSSYWDGGDARILHADILRRAGMVDRVVMECRRAPFDNDILTKIAEFEVRLAGEGRVGCYTVGHALGEVPLSFANEITETMDDALDLALQRLRDLYGVEEEDD